ncbi:MAG TPA: hypothetical protein DCS66_01425, partial [Flavobacteriaceae bacterium]|nr:hypothetical protein [Flavobacteriaceae bacterium]
SFGNIVSNNAQVIVSNSLGQIVSEINEDLNSNATVNINVSNYARGIYFVTIKTDAGTITKKLLKK